MITDFSIWPEIRKNAAAVVLVASVVSAAGSWAMNAFYTELGKQYVVQDIEEAMRPIQQSDSLQNERIDRLLEYTMKNYITLRMMTSDSIRDEVNREYNDLKGRFE